MKVTIPKGHLKNFEGEPLLDHTQKPLAWATAIQHALNHPDQSDNPETKYKKGKLAFKTKEGETLELAAEDIAMIKKAIGNALNPVAIVQLWDLLEGEKDA